MSLFNESVYLDFVKTNVKSIASIQEVISGMKELPSEGLVNIYKYLRYNMRFARTDNRMSIHCSNEVRILSKFDPKLTLDYMDRSIGIVEFICLLYTVLPFSVVYCSYDITLSFIEQLVTFHNNFESDIILRPIPLDAVMYTYFGGQPPYYVGELLDTLCRDYTNKLVHQYYECRYPTKIVSVKPERVRDLMEFQKQFERLNR